MEFIFVVDVGVPEQILEGDHVSSVCVEYRKGVTFFCLFVHEKCMGVEWCGFFDGCFCRCVFVGDGGGGFGLNGRVHRVGKNICGIL